MMSAVGSAAETRDIVIVGGGHNGLVAAFYLAKAGFKPLVLERRAQVGGAAITEELHRGFRCSTLAHLPGPLRADIVRDMQLEQHGLKLTVPEVSTVSLLPDGRALVLHSDPEKAAEEIAQWSQKDAVSYADFGAALGKIGKVIAEALALTPPNIDNPSSGDLWGMLQTGRSIRNLGKKDLYRVLRWGPMAVADLVAEFFDTEPLRATIAARGIFGTFLGPWSAGSALVLLLRAAADRSVDSSPAGSVQFPAGGVGAITQAMAAAAKQAGAEIRTDTEIAEIRVKDGVATGVILTSGEEIFSRAVVSNADPKCTLMRLVDPAHLSPDFIQKIKNYRCMGTVAKINLALSALPEFTALKSKGNGDLLRGRIQI
ncbi:MAG: NAD(P)/FAD-dependent oxidoreductase, partial [Terriglobales bacterium]